MCVIVKKHFPLKVPSCDVICLRFSVVVVVVVCPRRYTSARTLETSRTSVTIQAVERSLQQVAFKNNCSSLIDLRGLVASVM